MEDRGSYRCAAYNPVTHDLRIEPTGRKLVVTRECSAPQNKHTWRAWAQLGQVLAAVRRACDRFQVAGPVLKAVEGFGAMAACGQEAPEPILLSFLPGSSAAQPRILHPRQPQALAVPQRSPLTLECVAAGLPVAAVRWQRDGRDALRGGRWALQHSHLVTEGLQPEDSGNYSCVVGNGLGEVTYVNYSLTVLGKK